MPNTKEALLSSTFSKNQQAQLNSQYGKYLTSGLDIGQVVTQEEVVAFARYKYRVASSHRAKAVKRTPWYKIIERLLPAC